MAAEIYIKPHKKPLFYPARRGRFGQSLRVAAGALILGTIFIYGVHTSAPKPNSLMEIIDPGKP
jgi:hypothetical protein